MSSGQGSGSACVGPPGLVGRRRLVVADDAVGIARRKMGPGASWETKPQRLMFHVKQSRPCPLGCKRGQPPSANDRERPRDPVELKHTADYSAYGLDDAAQGRLAVLGDLILDAGFNVTGIKDPEEIERIHFLDSLSLLKLAVVREAERLADVGSGGGLPGLLLALALPDATVTCHRVAAARSASTSSARQRLSDWPTSGSAAKGQRSTPGPKAATRTTSSSPGR